MDTNLVPYLLFMGFLGFGMGLWVGSRGRFTDDN